MLSFSKPKRLTLRKITPEVLNWVYEDLEIKDAMTFMNLNEENYFIELEKYKKGISTFKTSFVYFQILNSESNQHIGWAGYHTWWPRS